MNRIERLFPRLRQLHPDHGRIARAAAWLLLLTALAKLAGAGREVAIAWRFGRGPEADAYNLATMLAMWLPLAIYSVMRVVVVPTLVRLRGTMPTERLRFQGELAGSALAAGAILSVATWVFAPFLVGAFSTGLPAETGALAAGMVRGLAPLPLLIMLVAVYACGMQAAQDHRYALAEGLPPLTVALLVVVWTAGDVMPLVVGTLAGFAWQAWWLASRARAQDGRPPWVIGLRSPYWSGLWRGALVLALGQFAMSFVQPIDQWFAADVGSGAIAALGYANRIIALGMALGATVIARATLPVFAEGVALGEEVRIRGHALGWARAMLAVGVVAAAATWPTASWIVAVIFERGAFSAADTEAVAMALRWGVWQLPPYLAGLVLVSQLAGEGRYKLIALIGLANVAAKLICTYVLADLFGLRGIMLATALMYSLSALLARLAVRGAAKAGVSGSKGAGER